MQININIEQDSENSNPCDTYLHIKPCPRLTVIKLTNPDRTIAVFTEELKKALSIL